VGARVYWAAVNYFRPLSRLLTAVLRGLRTLFWSALVATAQAQFVPLVARRSETVEPKAWGATAPEVPFTATSPHAADSPKIAHGSMATSGLTHGLFKYLAEPEPEPRSQHDDDLTQAAGLVISNGQVIGLTQDKHWFLGIGTDRLAWAGSGGFAAYGKDRTVIVHGDTSPLIWGKSKHFIGASDVLVFGASDSDATLIWRKKIDLGKDTRTIRVVNSLIVDDRASVRFDQGFVNGDLIVEGIGSTNWDEPIVGRADLSAANNDWRGNLTVRQADLHANRGALLNGLASITIDQGGSFVIDNLGTSSSSTGGNYLANRLSQFTTIRLNSGTLAYLGRNHGHSRDRTGIVELLGGANVIDVANYRPSQATLLTIGGMYRSNSATLNITNSNKQGGSFGTIGNNPRLRFRPNASAIPGAIPALESSIIPWATVNGADFATLKGKHLVAYTDYNVGSAHTWNATTNASPNADQYLSTDHSINSLRLTSGRKITLYGNTKLTLNAGALLSTGTRTKYTTIVGGELAVGGSGPRELYVHEHGGGFFVITSNISQSANAGPISLIKTGHGALDLRGHDLSALTGTHHIHEGVIFISRDSSGIGLGGHTIIGNHDLKGAGLFLSSHAMQRSARITLRGVEIIYPKTSNSPSIRTSSSHLRITSETEHILDTLTIEGSGLLSFGGPAVRRSLIAFDHITMADLSSELLVAHWIDSQTHLLISRAAGAEIAKYLGQIKFVDYDLGEESAAHLIDFDTHYWEIVPTGFSKTPEPATTGAILGAGALGFFAWRRRRAANK